MALLDEKNYMQKRVWRIIANKFNERGYNITEEQCNVKWKNLKQKYRSIRDRNNQTGTARECWEYFDMIDDFINIKPEVASIASSSHGFRIRQVSPSTDQSEDPIDENNSAAVNTSYGRIRNRRQRLASNGST
ncbi:hypothetical protein ALC57_00928 [Trachymyrmex cornetzi]|uniref:Myb/SANT-like DNA-binding domain-containing protein n=1 Tax=Trachymyrmex cornetzi TaxID=471704 RepID=A0A195EN09_9HYME|nr:hypothetical protein ALC57_00928 [Trachymyrmex cornetzi]